MESSHFFYVLQCADETFYAGYTNNLKRRLTVHNSGKGAKYTRSRLPVKYVYFEVFASKQEAMRAEYAFKQLDRAKKIQYMRR